MPKKTSLKEMRKWLDSYESGESVESIATNAHRDVRTIKRGIDEARREMEARTARAELLKEALHRHQSSLLGIIDEILSIVIVPRGDSIVLPWEASIFKTIEATKLEFGRSEAVPDNPALGIELRAAWGLLKEHLKRDPLWRMLADWQKARAAHLDAKIAFQRKTVALLEEKTGYKVVDDRGAVDPPFVDIHTAAHLFFEVAIRRVLGMPERTDPEGRIVADTTTGEVKHGGSVLAEAPGKEEECKINLLAASRELQGSSEAVRVANTYKAVYEHTMKTRKGVEEISLMGLVPGKCRICRRLGM